MYIIIIKLTLSQLLFDGKIMFYGDTEIILSHAREYIIIVFGVFTLKKK